ncbi:MAG: DUF4865 family protein [Alphaproteobacteria bacterium]|jgi:hypothetical protein|nr:DUF4865 family protein [Alphaproteobacteria bacterium]
MIAMQYTIRLAGDYDLHKVRERVIQRKPLFDGMDGLLHKAYLFNEVQAVYAPFYVWQCDDAARAFLTGSLFRDLVETFGRPRVRLWNVLAYGGNMGAAHAPRIAVKELDTIAAEENLGRLTERENERHRVALETRGLCFHLTGLDPDRWQLMRYSAWCDPSQIQNCDSDAVETFEILQLCQAECAA